MKSNAYAVALATYLNLKLDAVSDTGRQSIVSHSTFDGKVAQVGFVEGEEVDVTINVHDGKKWSSYITVISVSDWTTEVLKDIKSILKMHPEVIRIDDRKSEMMEGTALGLITSERIQRNRCSEVSLCETVAG